MPILNINSDQPQYGMKYGYADQAGLTGLQVGTNSLIVELLFRYLEQSRPIIVGGSNYPIHVVLGDQTGNDFCRIYINGITDFRFHIRANAIYELNQSVDFLNIYRGIIHLWLVSRNGTSYMILANGHQARSGAIAAHNLANIGRLHLFSQATIGGIATASIGCLARLYIGDLSGFTDAQLLNIHRKYLVTPFVTPPELAAYERFRWIGRQANGQQILDSSTTIQNCAPLSPGFGETLLIAGGLNWGQVKSSPIWVPR